MPQKISRGLSAKRTPGILFFLRNDEKKEDFGEEPICGRRGNGAYQKTANYLCDGKILCIDFGRKFDVKAADETRSGGVGVSHPFRGNRASAREPDGSHGTGI